MENLLSTKYATCVTISTLLFFSCPDLRSSQAIYNDHLSEELSLHQDYDPDAIHYNDGEI